MREEKLGFRIIRDMDYRSGVDYYILVNDREHREYGKFRTYREATEYARYYVERIYADPYGESESERQARILREKAKKRNNKIDQILG